MASSSELWELCWGLRNSISSVVEFWLPISVGSLEVFLMQMPGLHYRSIESVSEECDPGIYILTNTAGDPACSYCIEASKNENKCFK